MCRMSHGGRSNSNQRVDDFGSRNQREMRIHYPNAARGYYHFLGNSDPERQARHFRDTVGPLQPGEFVMLDVEVDPPADVGHQSPDFIAATLDAIESAFGVTPWLYIPQPGNYPNSDDSSLHRYPLMLPIYDSEPTFQSFAAKMGRPVMVWQWGGDNNGTAVPGINTPGRRVDSNIVLDDARFVSTLTPGLGAPAAGIRGFMSTATLDPGVPLGFAPPIAHGATGNTVILLQTLLVAHGIFQDVNRNRDGKFENGTRDGVKRFQLARGLPATGDVDRRTWTELASIS